MILLIEVERPAHFGCDHSMGWDPGLCKNQERTTASGSRGCGFPTMMGCTLKLCVKINHVFLRLLLPTLFPATRKSKRDGLASKTWAMTGPATAPATYTTALPKLVQICRKKYWTPLFTQVPDWLRNSAELAVSVRISLLASLFAVLSLKFAFLALPDSPLFFHLHVSMHTSFRMHRRARAKSKHPGTEDAYKSVIFPGHSVVLAPGQRLPTPPVTAFFPFCPFLSPSHLSPFYSTTMTFCHLHCPGPSCPLLAFPSGYSAGGLYIHACSRSSSETLAEPTSLLGAARCPLPCCLIAADVTGQREEAGPAIL